MIAHLNLYLNRKIALLMKWPTCFIMLLVKLAGWKIGLEKLAVSEVNICITEIMTTLATLILHQVP